MVGSIDYYERFDHNIPFLFKVLSVGQPLSLQAHPDKKLARQLHLKDPANYPDSNHKPELAIALTEFKVLCDFRPILEIEHFMKILPPFERIVGEKNHHKLSKALVNHSHEDARLALADSFKALMKSDKETISLETKAFLLDPQLSSLVDKDLLKMMAELAKLYPGDPGVFTPLFLNYLKLSPGQAIYLRANKLHAYLKGECIECMACSDNVVRAALTTKHRDVETLLSMLNYEPVKHANDLLFAGTTHGLDSRIVSFSPTEEFKVDRIQLNQENNPTGEYILRPLSSGSFVIVMSGKALVRDFLDTSIEHTLCPGSATFVPPKISPILYNIQGSMTIYRSYC